MKSIADIFFDYNIPVSTNTVLNTIVNTISVGELTSDKILIYPNPVKGILHIKLVDNKNKFNKLTIYNLSGSVVYSANKLEENIFLGNLQNGIYILKLILNDKDIIQNKIVVLR